MVKSGEASREYVDKAVRHVLMRQGVLGIKVAIMLPQDPTGKTGPKTPLSDIVKILDPKPETTFVDPSKKEGFEAPAKTL